MDRDPHAPEGLHVEPGRMNPYEVPFLYPSIHTSLQRNGAWIRAQVEIEHPARDGSLLVAIGPWMSTGRRAYAAAVRLLIDDYLRQASRDAEVTE